MRFTVIARKIVSQFTHERDAGQGVRVGRRWSD